MHVESAIKDPKMEMVWRSSWKCSTIGAGDFKMPVESALRDPKIKEAWKITMKDVSKEVWISKIMEKKTNEENILKFFVLFSKNINF